MIDWVALSNAAIHRFISHPRHRLFLLGLFVVFHSTSLQMPSLYLKLGHNDPHILSILIMFLVNAI